MNLFKRIKIKSNSLLNYYIFQKAGFPSYRREHISKSLIKKYLPKNPVVIDCGAHVGSDSIEMARIFGGKVHAFEPIPEIYERLVKNTAVYKNIKCYNLALSDICGTQFFYVSEGGSDASSSLLEPKEHLVDHPDTTFNKKIDISAFSLDEWASKNNIQGVDLLWLDMQGYELKMLSASEKILNTVSVIHTEVSTKETYKGVGLYNEYKAFLEKKGFKVIIEAIPDNWDMGNVLFVRK